MTDILLCNDPDPALPPLAIPFVELRSDNSHPIGVIQVNSRPRRSVYDRRGRGDQRQPRDAVSRTFTLIDSERNINTSGWIRFLL